MTKMPKESRRQALKAGTRRLVLDAAYVLFAEHGYEATTMRMLADLAGVGLGTIFTHFPDKPSLLAAVFEEDLGRVVADAFATLPTTGFKGQLLHLAGRLFAFYARDPGLSRVLVREALFLPDRHGLALDGQLQAFFDAVAGLLAQAADRGELPRSFSPADGALAFGAFYFGGLIMGLKQPVFDVAVQIGRVATLLEQHFHWLASDATPVDERPANGLE